MEAMGPAARLRGRKACNVGGSRSYRWSPCLRPWRTDVAVPTTLLSLEAHRWAVPKASAAQAAPTGLGAAHRAAAGPAHRVRRPARVARVDEAARIPQREAGPAAPVAVRPRRASEAQGTRTPETRVQWAAEARRPKVDPEGA